MLRIWCLLVPIMSYVPLVPGTLPLDKFDPCDAIDRTRKNLSDVAVIFAKLTEEKWVTNKTLNNTVENPNWIPIYDEFPGVLSSFYQCYGGPGGLKVAHREFQRTTMNMSTSSKPVSKSKCNLILRNHTANFTAKRVRIILSVRLATRCNLKYVNSTLLRQLALNPTTTSIAVGSVYDPIMHGFMSLKYPNSTINFFEASEDSKLYEILETHVDHLANANWNMSTDTEDLLQKYTYFATVTRHRRVLWPSIAAVLLVIIFFLIGLLICCCNLVVVSLVHEDFRKRNDEREWLAAERRRQEFTERLSWAEFLVNTSNLSDGATSSSSILDSTQLSETISGTIALSETQRSSESRSRVETACEPK